MTNTEPLDLDAIEARANRAGDEIDGLCENRMNWKWSIPANPDRDSDLILAASVADVPALIAEVRRLRGLTIGADDDPNVDTCWAVVLDDCGSADLYETREEADAARAKAPETGLDYIVTTTIVPTTLEETR